MNDSQGNEILYQELGAEADFPGLNPGEAIPVTNYGTLLSSHFGVTYWLILYVPNVSMNAKLSLKLLALSFYETLYGGDYLGQGSTRCIPVLCETTSTYLMVLP